jgi:hypothetical protein
MFFNNSCKKPDQSPDLLYLTNKNEYSDAQKSLGSRTLMGIHFLAMIWQHCFGSIVKGSLISNYSCLKEYVVLFSF